ncbi:butyrophilin-like protein 9 [Dryobates pubescens]|uniref:butyrophilin-like protein 9 n=1 Tax=Dryobates pubescens TaxID=118200 RepID=UPI0023B95B02|nr:butyrophilin-like protein 9 [Dryobates pubescens]
MASSLLWLLMSPPQPTAGGVHHPLLVLDGYEGDGIRLKCLSERLFADVQVLWRSGGGEDVLGTPLSNSSTANASSSLVLKPGSGNSVSCKVIDKVLRTSTESSVVIADVFFPATSPWLAAFIVILLLILLLVLSALYKIRVYKKITARESKSQLGICGAARGNAQKEFQEDMDQLQRELDEEKEIFEKENQELLSKIEFRRARSHAVQITLDESCKHPNLSIKEKNRVMACTQPQPPLEALVVAREGFSGGKHYWEVEVGDKSQWELGVVCEEVREGLRNNRATAGGNCFSLQLCQGEYSLSGEAGVRTWKPCSVVGVLLDQEQQLLAFFDVEGKQLLHRLRFHSSGRLYPAFSPGSDGKWLGVRPVRV